MALSRVEDQRLITGNGRYTSDWNMPGQLHGQMVRSDRAHADIVKIDASVAGAMPGVHAVIDLADLQAAGIKPYDWAAPFPGRGGAKMPKVLFPQLATTRVRFVGEPILMVVADTPAMARDAAEAVVIEYRELPATATYQDSTAAGATEIHPEAPGNVAFDYEDGDAAAVAAIFAKAKYVTQLDMESQRLISNPMEPRACLARWNADQGSYTLHSGLQGVGGMRAQLNAITGLPPEKLEIVAQDVGGSFGTRAMPYPEYLCAMAAARKLGRPVKWVGSRSEVFLSDWHGRALYLNGELALDADGNFLAIRFDDWGDLGAYPAAFGAFIATKNLTITMGGVYKIPSMYARVRCAYTNTTPVSAYRGAGRPDIAYAIERLVDKAAYEHGFDQVALRKRNHIASSQMPYKTPNGTIYDCGDFSGALDTGLKNADYAGFPARQATAKSRGKILGVGISSYLEASAGSVAPKDQTLGRFDANGKLNIYSLGMASGQGHETTFAEIVSRELGIAASDVLYKGSDPSITLIGNGTGGSRTLVGVGSSFKLLGAKLIENARPHAAHALECADADMEYKNGAFTVKGTDRRIAFLDLARKLAGPSPHPLDSTAEGNFGATFPNGCHVAEVELDPATGVITLERYTSTDDVGTVVSPKLVEGQVHGGVVQGVGQVLGEHAIYDRESAQFMTGSFMDYTMPHAGIIRAFSANYRPVPTATNALGAKGVGESGCSGAMPSTMNAVMSVLRQAGVTDMEMPATPARVWSALQAAQR
jgi:aerobic carbon-monoxide dehydrogenase large subunit